MRTSLMLALLGTFVMSVTVGSAQGPLVRATGQSLPGSTTNAAASQAGQGAQSLISGTAVDANLRPLPGVTVRLRNLETNQIEQVANANGVGEFTFVAKPQVAYVVEIVDQAGEVVAVGDIIMAQTGDVAGAIVVVPPRVPVLAGIFGETTGSVLSAIAGIGLTVVQAGIVPLVSPEK